MPSYNPFEDESSRNYEDAGYGPTAGGTFNEKVRRGRYADILAQLNTPLYDPMADASDQTSQIGAMSAGVQKSMGGKYKGIASKTPNIALVSAIKQAGMRGKEDERKKRLAMIEDVGGDAQAENLQFDEGYMNHILRQKETEIKEKQAKDQQGASTAGAGANALVNILSMIPW